MGYSTQFAGLTAATGQELDTNFNQAGLIATIPCTVSGTDTLTLAPFTASGSPSIGTPPIVLQTQLRVSGIAASSNTGAVTANVAGTGNLNVYKDTPSGPGALTGNEIIAGNYFVLIYDPALNSGAGGYHLENATSSAAGTVTRIVTGTGLAGGTITVGGTISLGSIANNNVLANISGGSNPPGGTAVSALIDAALGNTQGNILYRGSANWGVLAPGTSGQFLQTQGAAANPQWANAPSYTTGSWTPTLQGSSATGAPTYTTQIGSYEQIGRLIICRFTIVTSALGSPTGNMQIGGLPFTSANVSNDNGQGFITNMIGVTLDSSYVTLTAIVAPNSAVAMLFEIGSGQSGQAVPVSKFASGTTLEGCLIYHT